MLDYVNLAKTTHHKNSLCDICCFFIWI